MPLLQVIRNRLAPPGPGGNTYVSVLNQFDHHRWLMDEPVEPFLDTGTASNKLPITAFDSSRRAGLQGGIIGPIFGTPVVGSMATIQYPGGSFYTPQNLDGTTNWVSQTSVGALGGFFRLGFPSAKDLMTFASGSSGSNNLTFTQYVRLEAEEVATDEWHVALEVRSGSRNIKWRTNSPVWIGNDDASAFRHVVAVQPGDGGGVRFVIDGVEFPATVTASGSGGAADDWFNVVAAPANSSFVRFGPQPSNSPFAPESSAMGYSGLFVVQEAFSVADAQDLYDAANTAASTPIDYDEAIKIIHLNANRPAPDIWFNGPIGLGKVLSIGKRDGGFTSTTYTGSGQAIPTVEQTGKIRRRNAFKDSTSWSLSATAGSFPRLLSLREGTIGINFECPDLSTLRGLFSWTANQSNLNERFVVEIFPDGDLRVTLAPSNNADNASWSTGAGSISWAPGEWYRVLIVRDDATPTVTAYVNGVAYPMSFAASGAGLTSWWLDTVQATSTNTDFRLGWTPKASSFAANRILTTLIADFFATDLVFSAADAQTIEDARLRAIEITNQP